MPTFFLDDKGVILVANDVVDGSPRQVSASVNQTEYERPASLTAPQDMHLNNMGEVYSCNCMHPNCSVHGSLTKAWILCDVASMADVEFVMDGEIREFGVERNAFFQKLYANYRNDGLAQLIKDAVQEITEQPDIYIDFARFIAAREDERAAIEYCEQLLEVLVALRRDDSVGAVLMTEAELFDRIGVGMSRDLYALEAADYFVQAGRYFEAEAALALVAA